MDMNFLGYLTWISRANRFRMEGFLYKQIYSPKTNTELWKSPMLKGTLSSKPPGLCSMLFFGGVFSSFGPFRLVESFPLTWIPKLAHIGSEIPDPNNYFFSIHVEIFKVACIPHICLDGLKRCLFIQHVMFVGVWRWNGINHLQAVKPNFDVIWWCKIWVFSTFSLGLTLWGQSYKAMAKHWTGKLQGLVTRRMEQLI